MSLPWEQEGVLAFILGDAPIIPDVFEGDFGSQPSEIVVAAETAASADLSQFVQDDDFAGFTAALGLVVPGADVAGGQHAHTLSLARPAKMARLTRAQPETVRRSKLLITLFTVLMLAPHITRTGETMEASDQPHEVLRLSVIKKATNTIAARLSALAGVVTWSADHDILFPPDEGELLKYFQVYATSAHAATRAARLLEAFNFLQHTFDGGQALQQLTSSKLLAGYAAEQMGRMQNRKQASALPFWAVKLLEQWVAERALPEDELLFAGGLLLSVSLRARFSDFLFIMDWTDSILADEICLEVSRTKTSARITDRLPLYLIGPMRLASEWPWYQSWMALRGELGMDRSCAIFPARVRGVWQKGACTLRDANLIIQTFVWRTGVVGLNLSSHCGKATLLGWASTFGLVIYVLGVLAYHAMKGTGATRSYARDGLREPVAELRRMLCRVRAGLFNPDGPPPIEDGLMEENGPTQFYQDRIREITSGAGCSSPEVGASVVSIPSTVPMSEAVVADVLPVPPPVLVGQECSFSDSESDTISEVSSAVASIDRGEASSEECDEDMRIRMLDISFDSCEHPDLRRYQNETSGTVHMGRPVCNDTVMCGRSITGLGLCLLASGPKEAEDQLLGICKDCLRAANKEC